jgi:hypothetical protein
MQTKTNKLQKYPKIGLLVSVVIVFPVGIIYGFYPEIMIQAIPNNTNQNSFNKGIMGIYLVFGLYWLIALVQSKNLKAALTTNMLFMFGLFLGRIVSLFTDGLPSNFFILGTFGEFLLAIYSFIQLKKPE